MSDKNHDRKYLIAGVGGVGGSIAGFLATAGHNVTCIARGDHLQAIRRQGLRLNSSLKGVITVSVKACTAEEYDDKADVIFVCVKGYSVESIIPLIRKAAHPESLVIPILNVYGSGQKIQRLANGITVLDGCIYIVSFVSAAGEITQMGKIFRIVYGARKGQNVAAGKQEAVRADLISAGIKADISDDINRDTFVKWSYISAMACTGAYFNVPMRPIQRPGKERDLFIELSRESAETGKKTGIPIPDNLVESHLQILDKLDPDTTASLQKDLAKGRQSEIDGLLFQMIRMGEAAGTKMPAYRKIAEKFSE
ncbi:MAG: 2-dehydropantoate 2-reductase [Bacteroidales bacterium]|jgi:2-dehydropantoate 2-reductase|nr:2-dehydropantoate 2-reductase [Bacteroidales bacterium]